MKKNRKKIVDYVSHCKQGIEGYIRELKDIYSEQQVDIPVNSITSGISALIIRYTDQCTAAECAAAIPVILSNIHKATDGEVSQLLGRVSLYSNVRIFIHKNKKKIEKKFEVNEEPLPSSEKMPDYLDACQALAQHIVHAALDEFKVEIAEMGREEDKQRVLDITRNQQTRLREASGFTNQSYQVPLKLK